MTNTPAKSSRGQWVGLLLPPLAVFFFIGGPEYQSARSLQQIWNLGHIVFFALLTYLLPTISRIGRCHFISQTLLALFLALGLGLAIELLQAGLQRTVDGQDLLKNGVGAMVGAVFLLPARKTIPRWALVCGQGMVLIPVGFAIFPLLTAAVDEYRAHKEFPVLADFESPWEVYRWTGDAQYAISSDNPYVGTGALKVQLGTDTYSGVALTYFPGNWQFYGQLHLAVFNPDPLPLALTCRIHDRQHTQGEQMYTDRFNQKYTIAPGWNQIIIDLTAVQMAPQNRQLDLGQVRGLGIFATRLPRSRTIYLDAVRLQN